MKAKAIDSEKTIVIDIKLTKGLVVALSCVLVIVGLLAYLTLTGKSAVASEAGTSGETSLAQSTGMRQFYVTPTKFKGNQALTACAPGYHMASLWEIVDPSNLKYNTSLGLTLPDSGQGPPTQLVWGWVRTGNVADSSSTAGAANCDAWTISTGGYGTAVHLHVNWSGVEAIGVWNTATFNCAGSESVWCIED